MNNIKKIIIIIVSIFSIIAYAVPTTNTTSIPKKIGTFYATVANEKTVANNLVKGENSRFGILSIKSFKNGHIGLCTEPNVPYRGNVTYYRNDSVKPTGNQIAAYSYILNKSVDSSADRVKIIVAQFYAWDYSKQDIIEILKRNCSFNKSDGKILECPEISSDIQIKSYVDKVLVDLNNTAESIGYQLTDSLYIWSPVPGCSGQSFVSSYGGTIEESSATDIVCATDGSISPTTCEPRITVDVAGECEGLGQYDDKNDWPCLISDPENRFLDNTGLNPTSNPYCQIYCRENLISEFPRNDFTFHAGTFFTINKTWEKSNMASNDYMLTPIYFNGIRHCKMYGDNSKTIEGANTKKAIADFAALSSQTVDLYNKMQTEINKANALAGAYQDKANGECYNDFAKELNDDKKTYKSCPEGSYAIEGNLCRELVKYKYPANVVYKVCTTGGCVETELPLKPCGVLPSADKDNAIAAYNSNVKNINQIKDYMNDCNLMDSKYNLEPVVKIDVNLPGYSYNEQLKPEITSESTVSVYSETGAVSKEDNAGDRSKCTGNGCIFINDVCSGDYCTKNGASTDKYNEVNIINKEKIMTKTVSYSMNDFKNRFLIKSSGMVLESEPQHLVGTGTTINTEGKIVPISYYTKSGIYPYTITYSKVGNNGHFDAELGKKGLNPANYTCEIKIDNNIIEEGGGEGELALIYRKINLGNKVVAFPGMEGTGRVPGSNWSDENITKYIENNRGVKGDEVFNKPPIYSFKLTPKDIRDLKKYNRLVGAYNDVNYTCKDGYMCQSKLLRQPITINMVDPAELNATNSIHSFNFSSLMSGTCMTHDSNSFDTCRN